MFITHKHFPCQHHEFFHNLRANKETNATIVLEYDNQSLFEKGNSYFFLAQRLLCFRMCENEFFRRSS